MILQSLKVCIQTYYTMYDVSLDYSEFNIPGGEFECISRSLWMHGL